MSDPGSGFGSLVGLIAHGRDFGLANEPRRGHHGQGLTPEAEEALISSGPFSLEQYEQAEAAVERGELEEIERRTRLRGLIAALTAEEASDWLGLSNAELAARLVRGQVTAFRCDGELRYPAWQFIDDLFRPVLPGLDRLTPKWGDEMHPSSILAFMYNADLEIRGTDESFTPVEWLTIGGHVQVVLDVLESSRCR